MRHANAVGAAVLFLATGAASTETPSDRAFLRKAIQGDSSEIMLGEIAQTRGTSPGVKELGAMLVTDQTKAREDALRIAARIGVTLPTTLRKDALDERARLERLSGRAFDDEFARYMVKEDRHDIADFREEASHGHGAVADLAKDALPVLQRRLTTTQNLVN